VHASNKKKETSGFSPYFSRLSMSSLKIINVQLILTSLRPKEIKF
jgi:hypothetical protein